MKKTLFLFTLFISLFVSAQEQYYNGLDWTKSGLDLKDELATKTINAHTNILSYGWDAIKATDVNPENSSEVLLIYGYSASGTTARTRGINENGGGSNEWNREHTYAKSLGNPNLGTSGPGADTHHLRASDVSFNSQRGSLKFADGTGNAGSVSGGWYPGDEWKGDIARMMMYMYIRYGDRCTPNGVGIGNNANAGDDMIDLFLEWNAEDPVSDFERQRNTYHDSNANFAQGNRNPFIDNAYLATRIWGGTPAADTWGIFTSNDSEAPTAPTNVSLSNITTSTINVSWTASTDNEEVSKYEIYANDILKGETANTNYTLTDLNSNTLYAVTVLAKDVANNESAKSSVVNATTLTDTTAPSVPTNITITNQTGTSFKVNWSASTDDSAVTGYDIYVNGTLNSSNIANTSYTVTGLTISTTYSVTVLAKDSANNMSAQSAAINATTTDGSNNVVELFFSEYVEGALNNKALEIVNLTDNPIDLSEYSIKKQSNGAGSWINELPLSGTINVNDVFVVIHFEADNATLVNEADLVAPEGSNWGAPINFNGNDPVGLFKNGVLIDIIGEYNQTAKNLENMTLRRKLIITKANTTFTITEWDQFASETYDGIGIYNAATANTNTSDFDTFKMYPNPVENKLYFNTTKDVKVSVYTVLGKLVQSSEITSTKKNIDVSNLSSGIYIIKIDNGNQFITKKLMKN
ncbi:Por secretion system C-terminal sorting domain-containing protein [Polaribacter sp. KT25b]|uniref:endonuclease n=1 Tax=Polaribacter sp. KT25b TaxID=1855336 RepID=UPI00087CDB58|nr:endonuclease [Polaribacter sp. KT25b]SDR83599.1 Por secretion system C-terminal sorting domain-containing protein [Polaribacter sp. KT25b]